MAKAIPCASCTATLVVATTAAPDWAVLALALLCIRRRSKYVARAKVERSCMQAFPGTSYFSDG